MSQVEYSTNLGKVVYVRCNTVGVLKILLFSKEKKPTILILCSSQPQKIFQTGDDEEQDDDDVPAWKKQKIT